MRESRLVEIEIKGLAVCHYDTGRRTWNLEFICDRGVSDRRTHKLNFTNRENGINERSLIDYDELRIETTNFIELDPHVTSAPINPFNINAGHAHAGRLLRKRTFERDMKLIRLSVPYAQLSASGRAANFSIFEVINDGTPSGASPGSLRPVGFVGKTLTLLLKFSAGGTLNLSGRTGGRWERIDSINFGAPALFQTELDNDCGTCTVAESDFFMYYNCFRDTVPNKGFRVAEDLSLISKELFGRINCYPVFSDPAPVDEPAQSEEFAQSEQPQEIESTP